MSPKVRKKNTEQKICDLLGLNSTELTSLEWALYVFVGVWGDLTSQSLMYPSSWLVNSLSLKYSIDVVIESFVRTVPISLIFYTSINFIEWSAEPVTILSCVIQLTALIESLWIDYLATKSIVFSFKCLFFLLFFAWLKVSSLERKLWGILWICKSPVFVTVQKWPSSRGFTSIPRIELSTSVVDKSSNSIFFSLEIEKVETRIYSLMPPETK